VLSTGQHCSQPPLWGKRDRVQGPPKNFGQGIELIKEKIVFEEKEVLLLEEGSNKQLRVARRTRLHTLLRYLSRLMPPPLPLLPAGTRWLCQKQNLLLLVLEDPPQCRSLSVSEGKKGDKGEYLSYRLAFPFIVYILTFYRGDFEEMKMFYRTSPLVSPEDPLFNTNLPNVRGKPGYYGTQRVCLRYRPEMLEGVPLAQAATSLIEFFWSTGFNQDIEQSAFLWSMGRDPRIGSFEAWEEATRENPLFPLEVDWENSGRTLPSLWEECLRLHGETDAEVTTAEDLVDILYRLPFGY
jgi:hypothetical protein